MTAARWALLGVLAIGCASAPPVPEPVRALDRMMASPAARDVARDAPDAFADVTAAVSRARDPSLDDETRSDAALEARLRFERAQALAGAVEARRRIESADRARTELDADIARIEQETRARQSEVDHLLETRRAAELARQAAHAPSSTPAPLRAAAAAEMRQQATLFVAAARLLGASPAQLDEARARITSAERASTGDGNAALAAAGAAYAHAERLLSTLREGTSPPTTTGDATSLATALSDAGGMDPRRDARGVIAVMRGLFVGPRLAPTSAQRVETLARVIQGNPEARVRIEVFVGGPTRAPAESLATAQARALATALERAGVPAARLEAQGLHNAGPAAQRDDRVEVVLVLPTTP